MMSHSDILGLALKSMSRKPYQWPLALVDSLEEKKANSALLWIVFSFKRLISRFRPQGGNREQQWLDELERIIHVSDKSVEEIRDRSLAIFHSPPSRDLFQAQIARAYNAQIYFILGKIDAYRKEVVSIITALNDFKTTPSEALKEAISVYQEMIGMANNGDI